LRRGVQFEICYAPSVQDPSNRQHLFATARLLSSFTQSVVMSSGAKDAAQIRNPHDVSNLASLLGFGGTGALDCVGRIPHLVVQAASFREVSLTILPSGKSHAEKNEKADSSKKRKIIP
jgi:RNase P/RNase MRP subunit p30